MNVLEQEIKQLIIDALELEDIAVADIDSNEPLFVDGLGLDSIDALELGLAIKKQYKIKLDANSEDTKKYFASVSSLAEFIQSEQQAA
ncbi:phosphopantetheine-binding protein [Agarivorans gilvus]|jgi:acyl carrier protein|uniref:Acyl carrier protein n=1 Tax=Agarivorans gilvus TaxID=680279 RepID=A0ABQ1I1N8_9ALTE|nr:phosphopantetheine-binding protein [Agarivorans gilvus]GGB07998.1 acyl carrier protein [Agarivorans gilvus]